MALEFAFTQSDTPALRDRIERDLKMLAARVQAADPHLDALALTGGFSRGEGSARGATPLNDYDLVAVRDVPGRGPYAALQVALSEDLGIEIDLLPIWRARLPHVRRKLFWLDMRLGAKVIAGDPDGLAGLRRFERVEPGEVARLLGNRAAGLLLALPGAREFPDSQQRDLQAAKAAIAAMDATLLDQGRYAPTLQERSALMREHPDHDTFAAAIAWKLYGTQAAPSWEAARDVLLRAVETTRADARRDSLEERTLYLLRTRRFVGSPSQAVRERAWALLRQSAWPDGPPTWGEEKPRFFAARALTLQ